jgi:hypothetical protein
MAQLDAGGLDRSEGAFRAMHQLHLPLHLTLAAGRAQSC